MNAKSNEWELAGRRNLRHLAYWTLGWVLTMAVVAFGPKFLWDYNVTVSVLLILVNAGVGIGMILMNRKYVNGLDELHRQVTMDAMAIAMGVGVVGGLTISMLNTSKVISFEAGIPVLVMVMSITYFIGAVIGYTRYK